jgi:branched-chain amino acid transport system permease protein
MDFYLQLAVTGLLIGAYYGLVGLGLSFQFQVTGMLNMAYGAVVTVAGLTYAELTSNGWPAGLAGLAAVAVAVVLNTALGVGLRPWFTESKHIVGVLLTLVIGIGIGVVASMFFGKDLLSSVPVLDLATVRVLGVVIPGPRLVMGVAALAISIAFAMWLRRSSLGMVMRALVDDEYGAEVVGLGLGGLRVKAFAVAGAMAGVTGVLVISAIPLDFLAGFGLLVSGVTAAVVGGLSNPLGAIVGGATVGLIEGLSSTVGGSLVPQLVPIVLLIIVLVARPQGVLARRTKLRTV